MTNINAKFHLNPSTKYRDITSRRISVNKRTDGDDPKTQCSPNSLGGRGTVSFVTYSI